jgi:hypothetical protein
MRGVNNFTELNSLDTQKHKQIKNGCPYFYVLKAYVIHCNLI